MKLFQPIQWGLALLSTSLLFAPALSAATIVPQDDEKKEEAEEEEDEYLALVGGEIHTGMGGVLRDATILCKNGKIDSYGYDVDVP